MFIYAAILIGSKTFLLGKICIKMFVSNHFSSRNLLKEVTKLSKDLCIKKLIITLTVAKNCGQSKCLN